jgi:octaprenyl-diphosphate synthase
MNNIRTQLETFASLDIERIAKELDRLPRTASLVDRSAAHLLVRGGKRLRPLLVAMAARLGGGFDRRALDLAVAVELVHSATLLHDDVVDLGDKRRGADAARVIFGNAASIFAGDWLLIEALRRVHASGVPRVLDRLLDVIEEMIGAESVQLERRGRIEPNIGAYFRIIEGKTASLFRWSMFAGGSAGGLGAEALAAAELYGHHLGVAFQIVDDILDLGTSGRADKTLFADLREGKMTHPVLLAMERDPGLAARLSFALSDESAMERMRGDLAASVRATGAIEDSLAAARKSVKSALENLGQLPASEARTLLEVVAEASLERRS